MVRQRSLQRKSRSAIAQVRWGIGLVCSVGLFWQLVGSLFNIWYNLTQVQHLLSPAQLRGFQQMIWGFNLTVYPVALGCWFGYLILLWRWFEQFVQGNPAAIAKQTPMQRRLINLPWVLLFLQASGWLLCIPAFLLAVIRAGDPVDPRIYILLPISFGISALISIVHASFSAELVSLHWLYPLAFKHVSPHSIPRAATLSFQQRGILWVLATCVAPLLSMSLLELAPVVNQTRMTWVVLLVGGLNIGFGLISARLMAQWIMEPLQALQQGASAIATGDLNVHITLPRADEFGQLIDEFNIMAAELREKQELQNLFGLHVGQQAAREILHHDPGLGGVEQPLTILFADIRNFTARSAHSSPQDLVRLLNLFFTEMVSVIEAQHHGLVNKFLGDGFMALFGIGDAPQGHATHAIAAGQAMLVRLNRLNQTLQAQHEAPIAIGIGIHTGSAVVGSIGSFQRLEYTAIGSAVNLASRVESLTKQLQTPLLCTESTRAALSPTWHSQMQQCPPQWVKGYDQPIVVYGFTPPKAMLSKDRTVRD